MPPATDLTALTAALTAGFASVTAAIEANQVVVDLAPLTAEVARVADALYVTDIASGTEKSISQMAEDANVQVGSVIGTYSDGERVKVFNETPTP